MEESKLTNEMINMFEYVKSSENEIVKKGLKDYFNVMEEMNTEIERLNNKINKKNMIIEKLEQENFRIISESRKTKFEKFMDKMTGYKMLFSRLVRSEKSGF